MKQTECKVTNSKLGEDGKYHKTGVYTSHMPADPKHYPKEMHMSIIVKHTPNGYTIEDLEQGTRTVVTRTKPDKRRNNSKSKKARGIR